MKTTEGQLDAKGLKFTILSARFNDFIVDKLIGGAVDYLVRHGANPEDIDHVRIPGAFEMPLAAQKIAKKGACNAVICVGAVIRGSTPHFDFVANECAKGLAQVSLQHDMPIGFGVLTTDTIEQAIERAGSKAGNKGAESAAAALELVRVLEQI
jgi:6,7-dimethyl-8-ribityllumazine synthase